MQTQVEERAVLRLDASPELRQKVKVVAAKAGVTMREYMIEAVEEKLEEDERGGSK